MHAADNYGSHLHVITQKLSVAHHTLVRVTTAAGSTNLQHELKWYNDNDTNLVMID